MTRGGTPGDNVHMESFFHSLRADLVHGSRFLTEVELRTEGVKLYSRNQNDFKKRVPPIADAVTTLKKAAILVREIAEYLSPGYA